MDRQKEVVLVSAVLFGKYQLYGILGTGRAGTVFLAVHLGLEEYRAIKRVPKSFLKFEDLRREALVLKELRHPGIPIIYDVEEDEFYSYLIEEYLEGESLYDLVKKQGHLSRALTISYGIQLTSIISYLHLAGPNPILHLDLQPKNLLLCHDTIKLIDFGLAASLADANMPGERYGTVGCAAPEQYSKNGVLDVRTDIYAVGTIIHYLFTGEFPKLPYKPAASMDTDLAALIKRCIKKEKEERFSSAKELEERLRQLENMGTAAKDRLQSSSLTIALAGSKSGAGTTHIGIGLSVYLRNHGYPNLFEEKNNSGMGAGLGDYASAKRDQYGLMRCRGFVWKPYYGPGVKLKDPPFRVRILDYGKDLEQALGAGPDRVILICDGSSWSRSSTFFSVEQVVKGRIPYGIVYNHAAGGIRIRLPEGAAPSRCLKAPYYPDPFAPDAEAEDFYKVFLEEILEIKIRRKKGISGLAGWIAQRLTGMLPGKDRTFGKG
ncbi:serine/threonine protein kinase [Lacrimispora indolis]|uniref:serine/threonine protein kinase n=1 Tax=Lacrimispora indolis TaxID=69825 RepID=UPI0003F5C11B|nr:serine/threonine-protein kinase [[Clostridium] methoxybenzovorans]